MPQTPAGPLKKWRCVACGTVVISSTIPTDPCRRCRRTEYAEIEELTDDGPNDSA
jgi:ABC-type ATPase with predicted acetyltransferase domain